MNSESQQQADNVPTISQVEAIAALRDPILRNLQITQCYYELSAVLAARTGPCANWCTFATWASRQAGQTIRGEDLPRALAGKLSAAPEAARTVEDIATALLRLGATRPTPEIRASVWDTLNPAAPLHRAGDAVGRGNLKVFAEIAREFARFFSTCLNDPAFAPKNLAHFCQGLRPGDPPEGQRFLAQAFTHYYRSFFERDAKNRAELMLMANIDIGFHEQTRLQPEIAEAMEAAVVDPREFKRRLLEAVWPSRGWLARLRWFFLELLRRPAPFDAAISDLVAIARQQARLVITEHLMTLSLPHGVQLRLGRDLQARFPPSLQEITNPELRGLLDRLDPTPDSLSQTGAVDWAAFPERLHFIIDFFRCYQESPDLLEPPFTPEQTAALKSGRLPAALS